MSFNVLKLTVRPSVRVGEEGGSIDRACERDRAKKKKKRAVERERSIDLFDYCLKFEFVHVI